MAVDYDTGDALQLSGTCEILWDDHTLPGQLHLSCCKAG